jgi:hypothetical protein
LIGATSLDGGTFERGEEGKRRGREATAEELGFRPLGGQEEATGGEQSIVLS